VVLAREPVVLVTGERATTKRTWHWWAAKRVSLLLFGVGIGVMSTDTAEQPWVVNVPPVSYAPGPPTTTTTPPGCEYWRRQPCS